jgi:hypothetical protein
MLGERRPRLAVTIRPGRRQLDHHRTHKIVGQTLRAVGADQPQGLRDPHDLGDRFPVTPHHVRDPAEPDHRQPQPQHFANLEHRNLPVCHRRAAFRVVDATTAVQRLRHRPRKTPHQVVPFSWRKGGPYQVAQPPKTGPYWRTTGWSFPVVRRRFRVRPLLVVVATGPPRLKEMWPRTCRPSAGRIPVNAGTNSRVDQQSLMLRTRLWQRRAEAGTAMRSIPGRERC